MPTTDWIQETVEERYWEGRHGVRRWQPRPAEFRCAICGRTFRSADARSWHSSDAHPMARPVLYLGDRAAPSTVTVRTPVLPSEVTVGSSTSVTATLDGRRIEDVPPAEVGGLMAARRVGHLTVELENHRAADAADVRATYVIEIAIPEPEDLASVDRPSYDNWPSTGRRRERWRPSRPKWTGSSQRVRTQERSLTTSMVLW